MWGFCALGVLSLNLGIRRVLKNSKNQIVGFREEVRSDERQREREVSWVFGDVCVEINGEREREKREREQKKVFSFSFFLSSLCLISLPICTL